MNSLIAFGNMDWAAIENKLRRIYTIKGQMKVSDIFIQGRQIRKKRASLPHNISGFRLDIRNNFLHFLQSIQR